MRQSVFSRFLSRFDTSGRLACACGQEHRLHTKAILADPGALEASAGRLGDVYGGKASVWALSDENTEKAAGRTWKAAVRTGRITARVLPARPVPVPTADLVDALARDAGEARPDLLVAIGSGVISDLVKSVSRACAIPNWCIATAPSVDAYASATSALRVNGYHGAVPARVSEIIVCDPDVMAAAPYEMFLAGIGDLLAKHLAHLDWNLARMMIGEPYCPLVASVALESARAALAAAPALRDDPASAARALTDAALCSSLAMQATGGSRPAASAEHTMTHFWETTDAARNGRLNLHGVLAAAASRMVHAVYGALYEKLESFEPDDMVRLQAFDAELPWQETIEEGLRPFQAKVEEEAGQRHLTRGELARRLYAFREAHTALGLLARSTLGELSEAIATLERVGYPFSFALLELDKGMISLPFRNVRLLRRRYSSFDLAYELGLDPFMREEGERYLAKAE